MILKTVYEGKLAAFDLTNLQAISVEDSTDSDNQAIQLVNLHFSTLQVTISRSRPHTDSWKVDPALLMSWIKGSMPVSNPNPRPFEFTPDQLLKYYFKDIFSEKRGLI